MLNSAVAAYYYLRLISALEMYEPKTKEKPVPFPAGNLTLRAFPGLVLDYANRFATFVK